MVCIISRFVSMNDGNNLWWFNICSFWLKWLIHLHSLYDHRLVIHFQLISCVTYLTVLWFVNWMNCLLAGFMAKTWCLFTALRFKSWFLVIFLILISISPHKTDLIRLMWVVLLCEAVVMSSSELVTRYYYNIDCARIASELCGNGSNNCSLGKRTWSSE